jgi:hypothetical protein
MAEALGYRNRARLVSTGNLVFESDHGSAAEVENRGELEAFSENFGKPVDIIVRSGADGWRLRTAIRFRTAWRQVIVVRVMRAPGSTDIPSSKPHRGSGEPSRFGSSTAISGSILPASRASRNCSRHDDQAHGRRHAAQLEYGARPAEMIKA